MNFCIFSVGKKMSTVAASGMEVVGFGREDEAWKAGLCVGEVCEVLGILCPPWFFFVGRMKRFLVACLRVRCGLDGMCGTGWTLELCMLFVGVHW